MLSEDQYMEHTPDLVAKIRKMREDAEKEMDRFTRVADYDVRRVVGQGLKASAVSGKTGPPSPPSDRPKKAAGKSVAAQTSMEFSPAPAKRGDDGESQ